MTASSQVDPALRAYLDAIDPEECDARLEALLGGDVESAIRGAIRRTLGAGATTSPDEEDDVYGDVLLLLLRKLRALKSAPSTHVVRSGPIADFRAYAATVAYHGCYSYFRRKHPQWTRLKNQVRYVMTHDAALALQQHGDVWLCALAPGQPRPADFASEDATRLPLRALVKNVLARAGQSLELDDLVRTIAALKGVRDIEAGTASPERARDQRLEPAASGVTAVDERDFLRQVWAEVLLLPVRQRAALLLNLRDGEGRGVVALCPLTGVASIRQIAEALELPAAEFASLWHELPIDDRRIAERLGVTRQQVINLRKSARERLARRLPDAAGMTRTGNRGPVLDSLPAKPLSAVKGAR